MKNWRDIVKISIFSLLYLCSLYIRIPECNKSFSIVILSVVFKALYIGSMFGGSGSCGFGRVIGLGGISGVSSLVVCFVFVFD